MGRFESLMRTVIRAAVLVLAVVLVAACNLSSAPQENTALTNEPSNTPLPSRTPFDNSVPSPVTITSLPIPTQIGQQPTSIAILPPTAIRFPTATPLPVSIFILSPVPGNIVAGNVNVLGAATHPNFLQYQLEWGPDPNPGNLWFPASPVVQTPVINGQLGLWNTTSAQDGLYQLRLKVYLRDGTSLITVVNNIRVQNRIPTLVPTFTTIPRPIAAFSQDRIGGQAPLVVRFINQSSGNITSLSWNFGDGGGSAELNPQHTFRSPGVFTVQLTVYGPSGSSNVSRQISVQSATPPVAGFTQDHTSGESPLNVQFTDQSQGNITQHSWIFGDGSTSTEVNPAHIFNAVGTYNVILTVTGPGGSSSVTRQITVTNPTVPEPIAALVASPTEGMAPLSVQFDATDSSGQINSYNWTFGDGETGTGLTPTHIYQDAGTYVASLVVVGPGGQSAKEVTITVTQPPDAPVASFTNSTPSGDVPLTVNFDASGSTGPIDSFSWNFGDGAVGSGATVQHVYQAAGTYSTELVVQGPGGTDTASVEISAVEPIAPPVADFDSSPTSGPAPLQVQFTNQSSGENLTYEWDFGDGSEVNTDRDPLHTYQTARDYDVVLRVSNPGGKDEAQTTITVTQPDAPPVAAFDIFPASGPAPLQVQFSNQTSGDNLSFEWDFGDGSAISTDHDPLHVYQSQSQYTAKLTVTGPGGSDSLEKTVDVQAPIPAPDASFQADPTSGDAPLTVSFDSQGDPSLITSYFWEFGDNGTSVDPDPQHIYTTAGNYTVRLTVMGPGGQTSSEATIQASEVVVVAPPVAAFGADPVSSVTGQAVQFINQTQGDVTSYAWDFGDGATSTERDPTHTFTAAGTYPVVMTATNTGGSNSATLNYIVSEPAQPPQPAFTADPAASVVGQSVQFINQSSGDITDYTWDFGDGSPVSNEASPAHTFGAAGTYTVTLTASGPGGSNAATIGYTVSEAPQAPQAVFGADPQTGTVGQAVQFSDLSTGDITGYEWSFGDGSPVSNEQNPAHTFNAAGTFLVMLTVSGPGGSNSASVSYTVNATAQPPQATFGADPAASVVGQAVQFNDQSTGDITGYQWDFGDGSPTSNEQNPSHTFNAAGTYPVTLTVSGPGGINAASASYVVSEAAQPPQPQFSADPQTGTVGQPVQFTDLSSGDITGYQWDFGDSSPVSNEQNPSHTFGAAGDFIVTLTASGPGGSNSISVSYTVNPAAQPPLPAFGANPPSSVAGQAVQFINQTTGDVTGYTWDFGDGSPVSNEQDPTHTFAASGTYQVTLTASGPGGSNTATIGYSVAEPAQPPQAVFGVDPQTGTVGQAVQFTDMSTGDITGYQWDFGDGSPVSNEQNPAHTFGAANSYVVTLTVSGPGGSNSASVNYVVNPAAQPPQAVFGANPQTGTVGQPVQFTDMSTGDITGYQWDFGDGSPVSNEQNPAHTFGAANSYVVTLTVSGPGGSNSASVNYVVNPAAQPPQAVFGTDPASSVVGQAVQFIDQSTGDITGYQWDFGDGSPRPTSRVRAIPTMPQASTR